MKAADIWDRRAGLPTNRDLPLHGVPASAMAWHSMGSVHDEINAFSLLVYDGCALHSHLCLILHKKIQLVFKTCLQAL